MRTIEVHMEVVSESLSLDEVSHLMGMPPSPWSHSIGDQRGRGTKWVKTYWKTEEIKVNFLSYDEVVQGFKDIGVFPEHICELARTHGLKVNVVAGCFTDAGNLSLCFDQPTLAAFSNLGANIEICFYACSEMEE